MGEIGTEIARVANVGFRMKVIGMRRGRDTQATSLNLQEKSEAEPFFHSQYSIEEMKPFLSQCDYVVNTLPHTPQTRYLISG